MQTAVKEALASAIARGVNPRGVHRARTVGASVRARRRVCSATGAEGGAAASAESRSEETRVARPPPLRTYYADWAEVILPEGHRFPMEKYQATRLVLEQDKSLSDIMELVPSPVRRHVPFQRGTATCTFERPPRRPPLSRSRTSRHDLTAPSITKPPQKASLIDVLAVHEEGYVTRVLGCALTEKEGRAIGFPMMNPSQVTRSLASTGGTVAATHDVLRPGTTAKCAAQIAGGTHHAFRDKGEGFCVFNDIAVAATMALRKYPARFEGSAHPILVIDLDVHQGNGTAKIFEDDPRVITFSAHGAGNYPWKTKMRSDHDVDVPDGTGDKEYIAMLEEWLPRLFETYDPRLVYFQAGVDALAVDSFGKLKMTRAGMLRRNHMVFDECLRRDVPLVITMGGGYSRPFDASVDAHADVYRAAAYRFASPPPAKGKKAPVQAATEEEEGEEGAAEERTEEVAEEEIEKVVADVNADESKFTDKTKPPKEEGVKSDKFTTQIAAQIAALKSEKAQEMTAMTAAAERARREEDRSKLTRALRNGDWSAAQREEDRNMMARALRNATWSSALAPAPVSSEPASSASKELEASSVDWIGAVRRALRTVVFSALAPPAPESAPAPEAAPAPVVVDRRPARAPAPPPPAPPPAPAAAAAAAAVDRPLQRKKAPPPPPPPPPPQATPEPVAAVPEPAPAVVDPWVGVEIPKVIDRPPYPKPAEVTALAPGVEYGPALSRALRTISMDSALYRVMMRRAIRTVAIVPDAEGATGREDRSSYFLALGRALRDVDFAKIGGLEDARAAEEAEDMLKRARERVRAATAAKKDGAVPKVNVAVGSRKKKKKGGLAAPLAERAPAEEPAEVSAR